MTEVMDRDEVIPVVDVPVREIADLEITVNTEPEHTSDDSSSWAEQTARYILRLFQWEFQKLRSPAFSGLARVRLTLLLPKQSYETSFLAN